MELNKIYNESCLDTLSRIDDNSVDLVLQDTPFGVTQNEWDIEPDLVSLWPEWLRIAKETTVFVFFATQPFTSKLVTSNLPMFKYDWIWRKTDSTNFLNAKHQPLRIHEHIIIFYKKSNYFPQGLRKFERLLKDNARQTTKNYGYTKGEQYKQSFTNYPESVITFGSANNTKHPTQKPVDLIRYLIRTYSKENDLVFDGYMGSGTTAAACITENRNFIGSEISTDYFRIAEQRLDVLLKQQSLFTYQ